jgi:methionine-rich copper-binding protein CopC
LEDVSIMVNRIAAASLAAMLLLVSVGLHTASAHASLVRCSITGGAVFHKGHTPRTVQAFFAEDLVPSQSWINLYFNEADHGVVVETKPPTALSRINFKNPKELILQLPALEVGHYDLIWFTHSADDGHWAAGNVFFRVVK